MTNTTLIIRSSTVLLILTGVAHYFSTRDISVNTKAVISNIEIPADTLNKKVNELNNEETLTVSTESKQTKLNNVESNVNKETDYIIDKWKADYETEGYNGSVVYVIKKEKNKFNAYTYQYIQLGESQVSEEVLTLEFESFDGYKGVGSYHINFENEWYDIPCQMDMVDENTFKLSYDYYGYSDIETWKRY